MNLLPLILFVGVPIIVSFIVGGTLRYLPSLKRLRKRANEWDTQEIKVPVNPLTLNKLRTHANWGDKTVVVHYFVTLIYDIEFKIRTSLLIASILSGVVVMFVVVINAPKGNAATPSAGISASPSPTSSASPIVTPENKAAKRSIHTATSALPQPTGSAIAPEVTTAMSEPNSVGFWEGLQVVLDQMPFFYLFPVSALILILNSIFLVFNLFEQTNRYRRLVDES